MQAAHIPLCDTLSDLGSVNFTLFPNPASSYFIVQYNLPDTASVTATMFDITGSKRLEIINATQTKGVYQKYVSIDSTIANGAYIINFSLCNKSVIKKIIVQK